MMLVERIVNDLDLLGSLGKNSYGSFSSRRRRLCVGCGQFLESINDRLFHVDFVWNGCGVLCTIKLAHHHQVIGVGGGCRV